MGAQLTDRVRRILALAREEALRLQQDYIGTEHVLLGMIRDRDGVAIAVLVSLGIDLDEVRRRVEESLKPSRTPAGHGELPFSRAAKRALEAAIAESEEWKYPYLGTEMLLLGLLHERNSNAAQLLESLGARHDLVLAETRRLLGVVRDDPQPH